MLQLYWILILFFRTDTHLFENVVLYNLLGFYNPSQHVYNLSWCLPVLKKTS